MLRDLWIPRTRPARVRRPGVERDQPKSAPVTAPRFSQSRSVHFELPAPYHSPAGTRAPWTLSYPKTPTQRILRHCPSPPVLLAPPRSHVCTLCARPQARPSVLGPRCDPDTAARGPGGTLAPPPPRPCERPAPPAPDPGRRAPCPPHAQIPVLAPGNPLHGAGRALSALPGH